MRSALLIALSMLLAPAAFSQSLSGTYRLVSFTSNYSDGVTTKPFGDHPGGYVIITPKRFMVMLGSDTRKPAGNMEERAALQNSLIAYTGPYTIEGNKVVTDIDVSWNQAWTGTQQRRTFTLEGNQLTLVSDLAPSAFDPSRMVSARLVWERVE